MKKAIKLLSLLLCVLMLIGTVTLVSCGDTENNTESGASTKSDNTKSNDPSESEDTYQLRDLSDGNNLNSEGNNEFIVYQRGQNETNYGGIYIIPSEDKTDVISQEAFSRNAIVEQAYDVKLKCIEGNPNGTIAADYASGLYYYDIVLDLRIDLGQCVLDGYMYNLNNLDIDYSSSYWDKNAEAAYTVKNKLYLMPNDVSVSNLGGTKFIVFSKALVNDFHLTDPYEYFNQNNWTLETFYSMIKQVSAPATDSSAVGIYGMIGEGYNELLVSCGVEFVSRDAEDNLVCEIGSTYAEKAQNLITDFQKIEKDSTLFLHWDEADELDTLGSANYVDMYSHGRALFNEDHFLFIRSNMNSVQDYGDMKMGYGIIVNPKADKNQEKYYHGMDAFSIIWGVVDIPGINMDRLTAVMDYWAYVSTDTVMEAYYELTLKTKRVSDPTAASMLDTIKANIKYSPSELYGYITINNFIDDAAAKSVTSAWKSNRRKINSKLQEYSDILAELD